MKRSSTAQEIYGAEENYVIAFFCCQRDLKKK
jgi:hypothetical protein